MLYSYNIKNFISNLNNIFFFYNLRKTKKIKNWFLYLYWTYLLHELSKYTKLYYILKKKKKWKNYYNYNNKYNLYKKYVKFNLKLKKIKLKKYYKHKILLTKATISYFFDFLIKFIKTKKINEDKFFLLKKLNFWKVNKQRKFFTGFNYYKLFMKKRKKFKKRKLSSIYENTKKNESEILNIKLDLFSLSTYNLKWHSVLFICNLYKSYYSLNTLMDVMQLLDRKIDYFLINWFNLSTIEIISSIQNKLIKLNSSYLADTNYIIENGSILTINTTDKVLSSNLLFLEKRIFYIFLFLNENYNKFSNYINWFTYLKIKKNYILNLIKIKFLLTQSNSFLNNKKTYALKYIDYFYKITSDYASIFKKNMDIVLHKKASKSKKFSQIKVNFFITVIVLTKSKEFYLLSNITNSYIKTVNHVLILTAFYYILKKKIIKLRALKKKNTFIKLAPYINFNNDIIRYFKNGTVNILLFININKALKNVLHINYQYLLYFIYNTLTKNINLNANFLHKKFNYSSIDNFGYSNKIFQLHKKNKIAYKYKNKKKSVYFKTNSKFLFINKFIKKSHIQFYRYRLITSLLYNYIHNNNIISYKTKILFYNLEKNNAYINKKSKWLRLFDLNENVSFKNLKKK